MRPMRGRRRRRVGIPGAGVHGGQARDRDGGGSVLCLLTRDGLGALLLLIAGLLGSFLWQPFTYGFIETSPMGIIFGAIIIWSIGGWLERVWGSRRLLLVRWGVTALAGPRSRRCGRWCCRWPVRTRVGR